MQPAWIDEINSKIYRQFPELKGVQPKIQPQGDNFLAIYQIPVKISSGTSIQRIVRAVVDKSGNLIKVSISR